MPTKLFPDFEHVEDIHNDVVFPNSSPYDGDLPYVAINMVSSLDGKASSAGESGAIGSEADRTSMRVLRSKVDAVISGSGTLRAEKVSLTSEGRRSPEPLAIIPSVSLDLPLENLLNATPERTFVITTKTAICEKRSKARDISKLARIIDCSEDPDGSLDYEDALRTLKQDYGIANVLVEGGPSLNHRLLSHHTPHLAQELFVTIAPKLLGGPREDSHTIIEGELLDPEIHARLITLHLSDENEIFTRYNLAGD